MKQENPKQKRMQELIKREVNSYLRSGSGRKEMSSVTITVVQLSPDFKAAKLYWDTYNSAKLGQTKSVLLKSGGKIRHHLSQVLSTRNVPTIDFVYDSQFESEQAIEKILSSEAALGKGY